MAANAPKRHAQKNRSETADATAVKEPIWVFESNPGATQMRGAEEIAVSCLAAKPENGSGPAGNTYAIVTRDANNALLPFAQLKNHVDAFLACADKHSHREFRLVASPHKKSNEEFTEFSELFRKAPQNCALPGRCLEVLEKLDNTRVILLDANVKEVDNEARHRAFRHYFAANEAMWPHKSVEIVSFGLAHTVERNAKFAEERNFAHHVPQANPKIYRRHEALACHILALTYATKMVCFSDPAGTSTDFHMQAIQFAVAAALDIDEVTVD
jgi:hypothetical protein